MKLAIGADHGGYPLKADLVELLAQAGHEPIDLGAHEYLAGDDYPDYALLVGRAVQSGQAERGIVICGSGVGACIAANKMTGIRAGVCHDTYSAHQGVEHDDMNVLCLGARIIGVEPAREIVLAFVNAAFNTGERYRRRLNKVLQIERDGVTERKREGRIERQTMNNIQKLAELGQSIWFDNIQRRLLTGGGLQAMIDEGLLGMTSNPTIFEKAIGGSSDYDAAMRPLVEHGAAAEQIYDALTIEDVGLAADIFRPVFDRTRGQDGYVSIEVSPRLAHDTAGTLADARRLWQTLKRPNVMIKIPATRAGLPAIEQALTDGINVNVTLMFSMNHYVAVADAYLRALEARAQAGQPIDHVASVASFFVSRVDTLLDARLEQIVKAAGPNAGLAAALAGRAAVANSQLVYGKYLELFGGDRFQALATQGARPQRVLWASTSTKNPRYLDVLYVDTLIGPDTVNTVPPETYRAILDHTVVERTVDRDLAAARQVVADLESLGFDLNEAGEQLSVEGVAKFTQSFDGLLKVIEQKRAAFVK